MGYLGILLWTAAHDFSSEINIRLCQQDAGLGESTPDTTLSKGIRRKHAHLTFYLTKV